MAFVVEDGTGLSNANAYISVAFFVEYHTDRGRDLTDPETGVQYTDTKIQQAIVVVSDYLDTKFRYHGIRKLTTQSMEFPRVNIEYWDGRAVLGVPVEIKECAAELGLKQLSEEIAPDPTYDPSLRLITAQRNRVGPIEQDTKFTEGGAPISFRSFPFAEERLKELVITGTRLQRV